MKSLATGMKRTGYYFTHHKEIITEQYPDNRDTLVLPERFKGEVVMIHDENNEHACTGCTACELACPNATIKIITKFDVDAETGKKKKAIDTFVYHLELCTMCNLCVRPVQRVPLRWRKHLNTVCSTEINDKDAQQTRIEEVGRRV
jgi:NADH-quinone oxidoreductase subunit I